MRWYILAGFVSHLVSVSSGVAKEVNLPSLQLERRWKTKLAPEVYEGYDSASFQIMSDIVYVINGGEVGNDIVMFDLEGK